MSVLLSMNRLSNGAIYCQFHFLLLYNGIQHAIRRHITFVSCIFFHDWGNLRTGTITVQGKTQDFYTCALETIPLLPSLLVSIQPALPLLFHRELLSLHAGIHLASALKASAWTWWAQRQTTLWVWGRVTSVIWYASCTLTLFVICNGRSRQDASDHVKCFINTAKGNISSPKSVRWIKFTHLRFSALSRVTLQGFVTINSPLCTDAPPKAKEKQSVQKTLVQSERSCQ